MITSSTFIFHTYLYSASYIVVICYDGQNNLCDFKFLSIHILNPRQK